MTKASGPRFEAKDPRFEREEAAAVAPPVKRSGLRTCVIGCLMVAAVAMLLVVGAGVWLWRNARELSAMVAVDAMNRMIDTTDLPVEERREMKAEVERVADAFRERRITDQQMAQIVREIVRSPLLVLIVVSAFETQYFQASGLTAEEKAAGRLALQRFVRGAMDKKIKQDGIDAVLTHIGTKQPDGNYLIREKVSDQELRSALAEAKRQADEVGVPEQPQSVDASAELKRIVDEAMK